MEVEVGPSVSDCVVPEVHGWCVDPWVGPLPLAGLSEKCRRSVVLRMGWRSRHLIRINPLK